MLKFIILISIYIINANAINIDEQQKHFITPEEYGKLLYFNPRGIGCHLCHGKKGEGKFIVSYKEYEKNTKNLKTYKITAPNIQDIKFESFKKYINNTKVNSIMPKYFLTNKELKAIHLFLKDSN